MIDFSKCTLQELQAMADVLDDLTYRMSISETMKAHMLPYHYYKEVSGALTSAIDQHVREAEDKPASLQAREAGVAAANSPAEPDMFGWVGDALDDLCTAGEVLCSNE